MNNEETLVDAQQMNEPQHQNNEKVEQPQVKSKSTNAWAERSAYAAGGAVVGAGMTLAGQAMAAEQNGAVEVTAEPTSATSAVEAGLEEVTAEAATMTAGTETTATAETETAETAQPAANPSPNPSDSPTPEDTIVATATGVRVAQVNDNASFAEAFADARAQVGPGGVFEWHGRAYSTYYKEEWDNMSSAERHNYQSSIDYNDVIPNENAGQQHSYAYEPNSHANSQPTAAQDEPVEEVHSQTAQVAEEEDVDVQVLEVGQTDLNQDGIAENAAVLEVNGHEVLVVDIDQDGVADIALSDVDNDGQMDAADLRGQNLAMPEMSSGDMYMAQADEAPDYMNDANVDLYQG